MQLMQAMPNASAAAAAAHPLAATSQEHQRGLACQACAASAAPHAVPAAAAGAALGGVPGGAATGVVLSPATQRTQLQALRAQLVAAQAAAAEAGKCAAAAVADLAAAAAKLAATQAAAAEANVNLAAQSKLVLAALDSHMDSQARDGGAGASCTIAAQLWPTAATLANAAAQWRLDGAAGDTAGVPLRTAEQIVAAAAQAAAAATAAGIRPFPRWGASAAWRSCGSCTMRAMSAAVRWR